jgi:hypothetical protein
MPIPRTTVMSYVANICAMLRTHCHRLHADLPAMVPRRDKRGRGNPTASIIWRANHAIFLPIGPPAIHPLFTPRACVTQCFS